MNKTDGSIVGCEIELESGRTCRVQAIGRCATCERAFCLTHQGRDYRGFHEPYVDRCAPCVAQAQADEMERLREHRAKMDEAREYFASGAARTALLTAGVPPVKIRQTHRQWKNGLFGLGAQEVDVTTTGRGWILGSFEWSYSSYGEPTDGSWLTALMDDNRFVRVGRYSRRYEAVGSGGEILKANLREVVQAVKRLTGESS
jgi:hypothetical protein